MKRVEDPDPCVLVVSGSVFGTRLEPESKPNPYTGKKIGLFQADRNRIFRLPVRVYVNPSYFNYNSAILVFLSHPFCGV